MAHRERVTITNRGGVTIPAALRRAFGLKAGQEVIVEDTPEGILLRPAVSVAIEVYSEDRIAEFTRDEDELAKRLDEPS